MNGNVSGEQYLLGVASFFTVSLGGLVIGIFFGLITALITRTTREVRGNFFFCLNLAPSERRTSLNAGTSLNSLHTKLFFCTCSGRTLGRARHSVPIVFKCRAVPLFRHHQVSLVKHLNTLIITLFCLQYDWMRPRSSSLRLRQRVPKVLHNGQILH